MKQLMKWMVPIVLLGATAWADASLSESNATVASFSKRDPRVGKLLKESVGYVVFPEIKKGAFIFGGAGGEGILFEHGVPVGEVKMTQVTIGAQVGGQTYAELVFIADDAAMIRFRKGQGSLSAQASAAVAGQGARAAPPPENGLTVFTMPISGLMAEAAVGGQKFDYHPYVSKPAS